MNLLGDGFQEFHSAAKRRGDQIERIGSPCQTRHRVHVFDFLDCAFFPLSLPRIERQDANPFETGSNY